MKRYLILFLLFVVAMACDPISEEPPQFEEKQKTILIYMVANNNLSSQAQNNLESMKKGYVPAEDNLLVYMHLPASNPLLLRLYRDADGSVAQDTVYRFPPQNSAETKSLANVLKVSRTMYPAQEYGLVLWSHGTGWLPQGYYSKSFGADDGKEMDVIELAKALPYKLEFVIFDACLMGGIEVAYELKDSVNYVLSSPAEILSQGFPYDRIMKHIFKTPVEIEGVAREYFDFYNGQSGSYRSATVSLVKSSALGELATEAAKIFKEYSGNITTVDTLAIQRYYRGGKHWFYDLGGFVEAVSKGDDNAFKKALDNAVVYKDATPYFIEIPIDRNKYSGLSTYIPSPAADPELLKYYANFKWSKDTGYLAPESESQE